MTNENLKKKPKISNEINIIIPVNPIHSNVNAKFIDNTELDIYHTQNWDVPYFSPPDSSEDFFGLFYNEISNEDISDISNQEIIGVSNDQISEIDKINKYAKSLFRDSIIKIYKRCLITGVHRIECDAAHIVPVVVCHKYQLYYKYHKYNGLLLCKNLHITYDNFIWTFDIYDIKRVENSEDLIWICPIIKKFNSYQKHTIHQYEGNYFKLPIKSVPYLYLHYQIFFEINYKRINPKLFDLYQKYIETDKTYEELLLNPKMIWDLIHKGQTEKKIWIILDKKYNSSSLLLYQVLNKYQPFCNKYWYQTDEDHECELRDIYENFIETEDYP